MKIIDAAKAGDLVSLKKLISEGSNLSAVDDQGYTSLHWACALGHNEVVKYLLNHNTCRNRFLGIGSMSIQLSFNQTPLMTAAKFNNTQIVELLLERNIYRVNEKDFVLMTALHFAAESGALDAVRLLITKGAEINSTSLIGNSSLMYAAQNGHYQIVELLINYRANVSIVNKSYQSAVDLALKNDNHKIVALLLRANTQCVKSIIKLDHLVQGNPDLVFINSTILRNCRSPISILNNLYSDRYKAISSAASETQSEKSSKLNESFVCSTIRNFLQTQNRKIISSLITFRSSLLYAAEDHITEEVDIKEKISQLDKIIIELFRTEALDKMEIVLQLLLPDLNFRAYNEFEAIIDKYSSDIDNQDIVKKMTEEQRLWILLHAAYCIAEDGVINDAIERNLKILFQFSQISAIINEVFYHPIIPPSDGLHELRKTNFFYFDDTGITDMIYEIDKDKIVLFLNLRYCPIVNLYFELVSKVITLMLVWTLSYYDFQPPGVELSHTYERAKSVEIFFAIVVITSICYEIGQLQDEKWNLRDYFTLWNSLDVISIGLMLTWVIIRYSTLRHDYSSFYVGFTALSVSAIPLSAVLLQYVSMYKEVGILIIIITAMSYDVLIFLTVYMFCMIGFAITFQALFYDYGYDKILISMLTLYSETLGTFDLQHLLGGCVVTDDDDGSSSICPPEWVLYIGTVLNCIFVGFSLVLLINLLIAKFSNTYQKINDSATAEWSYFIGKSLQQNIILKERSPLCMLPPPFNLITIIVTPFQYFFVLSFGISIAGTLADWLCTILGVILSYIYISFQCTYKLTYALSVYRVMSNQYKKKRLLFSWLVISSLCLSISFICLFISFVYVFHVDSPHPNPSSEKVINRNTYLAIEAAFFFVIGSLFIIPCLARSKFLLGKYYVQVQKDGTIVGLEPNLSSDGKNESIDTNNPMIQIVDDNSDDRADTAMSLKSFTNADVFADSDINRILSVLRKDATQLDLVNILQSLKSVLNDINSKVYK